LEILLVDNYDSFTYNLVHYLEALDCHVTVARNDELHGIAINQYDKIVISPGPGLPAETNDLSSFITQCISNKPILGVCLGFQSIVEHFGGTLINQQEVKHGIQERCLRLNKSVLLQDMDDEFKVGLYHSWAAKPDNFPKELIITSISENKVIMSYENFDLGICGVQFHPESVLTDNGMKIMSNFVHKF
jgi:anthranilate synthase component 2